MAACYNEDMEEIFDVLAPDGSYTGETATRGECHQRGLWHKAVVVFVVSSDNKNILLQLRSADKKLWPNLWDVAAGGHVDAGELGYQAALREAREELGLDLEKEDLEFIGATTSENHIGDVINNHYNEYYVTHSDAKPQDLKLQPEEVQDARWFSADELAQRVADGYDGLTDKVGCWNHILHYLQTK